MRIHATLSDHTTRRRFRDPKHRKRPLIVFDHTEPGFGMRITADDTRTFFVRLRRPSGPVNVTLGTTREFSAAEARTKARAVIEAAAAERTTGPLFRDFAKDFMRRRARLWKPATRRSNEAALRRQILPFFGAMRVADIARADVTRWFDGMSGTPGTANRALPVLSVMLTQAEQWDFRPQGSNPCRNMRRYRVAPRERFLSTGELRRLGFVLDHADDTPAAAAVRLLLFTGARSAEITGLRWDWIRGTRALLPDSKTGPKAIQLPPPAQAVLAELPRTSPFVFPNTAGDGPMTDLGSRWATLRALAGLDDVRLHDCRHTFASYAVMTGLDLYTVGRVLGHADTGSTARYAHLADHHVRAAAGKIGRIVNAAMRGTRTGETRDAA